AINSKIFDFSQKTPSLFKNKELEIRTIVSSMLERGKIDLCITIDQNQDLPEYAIDKYKVKNYYKELENIAGELGIHLSEHDLLKMSLGMPEIVVFQQNISSEALWLKIRQAITDACLDVDANRTEEGKILAEDFVLHIEKIVDCLGKVENFEQQRMEVIKNRLKKQLNDLLPAYDENRFEQELIYYLEKIDITEEKVRLKNHCNYFIETMQKNAGNGKKLSFILQETGREINTLGSKANDADIQKLVIIMKDELEKIKEQLANVL
ncbi:MAG: DUF1732 domain-containing protein, partial [Bacteroidales bacterium]|nr:DUF1732 domain-containing protein [Bacteroidales bacterium]